MFEYRPYQQDIHDRILKAWDSGHKNVMLTSDVASGKTVIISNIVRAINDSDPGKLIMVIAHRQELVSQISLSIAENDIEHNIIASHSTIKLITQQHVRKFKRSYYRMLAPVTVASVHTINNRKEINAPMVVMWVIDEAHHVVRDNVWGRAVAKFTNARGLGVTATACRSDGKGLGAGENNDGVFHTMVKNKMTMGDLIKAGNLSRFMIYAPSSDINLTNVNITKGGDFSKPQLSDAVGKSHIVGDVVDHYIRLAKGKLGVTFVPDTKLGELITKQFNDAGIPAALITAKTPDKERARVLDEFESRQLLQLVNVDIFGEGFNLPAIEVVSFARPTASYGLYVQQFGRALRVLEGKTHAIIIDHVGNVQRHGLPTQAKAWTLDRREKTGKGKHDPDKMMLKVCKECTGVYEAFHTSCPYCGSNNLPDVRSSPKFVDGDLVLLDISVIDELHKEISRIDGDPVLPISKGQLICRATTRRHNERKESQDALRLSMAKWSAMHINNFDLRQRQKMFYIKFDIDVLTAQTLGKPQADKLRSVIDEQCARLGEQMGGANGGFE